MALSVTDTCLVPIGDGGTLGYLRWEESINRSQGDFA
jgi:hypothetical protein